MSDEGKLADEEGRLAALHRYQVLDTAREEPFDNITGLVQTVLSVPIAAVTLIDRDRQWFKSIQGLEAQETERSAAFCSQTIKRREPMIIPDTTQDARFADHALVTGEPHIRSYAGVPLETPDGYNLGSLCAIDYVPRAFDASQIGILRSFAKLVVDELELRLIATSDPLTGALSRRGWLDAAKKEISRARRHGRAASVALLDLDEFKDVNDTHGHAAGDEVLRVIGGVCTATIRESDIFGRIGGEEFALLMPEADAEHAMAAAERVREAVERTPVEVDGARLRVTVSIGVAPLAGRHEDAESWRAEADQALYRAKRGGRNQTALATGSGAGQVAV